MSHIRSTLFYFWPTGDYRYY